MDVTVVWEKTYVLSLNGAKLEFSCIVELVYHCLIMTRWCPCGSVDRANTDVVLVLFMMHMALCPFYTSDMHEHCEGIKTREQQTARNVFSKTADI